MARSLSKIQEQIAKLQKEADAIQSTVIARLKREIAQYGLTVDNVCARAQMLLAERLNPSSLRVKSLAAVRGEPDGS